MFGIDFTSYEKMYAETVRCIKSIQGIKELISLQNELYFTEKEGLNFCGVQIDEFSFVPEKRELSVKITDKVDKWCAVLDFSEVEIEYLDITSGHFVDEVFIEQNADGKYSITFGTGELDFRYSSAKLSSFWSEK